MNCLWNQMKSKMMVPWQGQGWAGRRPWALSTSGFVGSLFPRCISLCFVFLAFLCVGGYNCWLLWNHKFTPPQQKRKQHSLSSFQVTFLGEPLPCHHSDGGGHGALMGSSHLNEVVWGRGADAEAGWSDTAEGAGQWSAQVAPTARPVASS